MVPPPHLVGSFEQAPIKTLKPYPSGPELDTGTLSDSSSDDHAAYRTFCT